MDLQREANPVVIVVIKLPALGSKKGSSKYPLPYRNDLIAHRPWNGQIFDTCRNVDWDDASGQGGAGDEEAEGDLDEKTRLWAKLWESFQQRFRGLFPELELGECYVWKISCMNYARSSNRKWMTPRRHTRGRIGWTLWPWDEVTKPDMSTGTTRPGTTTTIARRPGNASAKKTSPLKVRSSRYSGNMVGGHRPMNVMCP